MLRLWIICILSFPLAVTYLFKMKYYQRHYSKYSEEQRYKLPLLIIKGIMFFGRIRTEVYGKENLPKEGGYIMYSNHQGKYDTLGIVYGHSKPCGVVIDEKRSTFPFVDQFVTLTDSCRMDKDSMRAQMETIITIAKRVAKGKKYIIFPEGGYDNNGNEVLEFLPGAFKCALRAKCPIVPTVIIDSYKVFGINSWKPVTTKVFFLPAINFEEYDGMRTNELAEMVKARIVDKLNEELKTAV